MTERVQEYLAENDPGRDMSRVANDFMHRFTHGVSTHESLALASRINQFKTNLARGQEVVTRVVTRFQNFRLCECT